MLSQAIARIPRAVMPRKEIPVAGQGELFSHHSSPPSIFRVGLRTPSTSQSSWGQ